MPPRKTTASSVVSTGLKRRSGQQMGFLPWCVSLFPVGLPLRPTSVQMDAGKSSSDGERAQMFDFIPNLFVCPYVCVACLSQNFLSFLTQFVKVNLLKSAAPSVCFGFVFLVPRWSRSVDITLYCLFVECVCIRSALHTFPVSVGLCKNTASLASSAEQTTALSKYLPAPTLSQLAVVDFLAEVQMRPEHVLMTSNRNKYAPPHTFSCI